jgi:cytoskeletal protein RodZ
MMSRYLVCLIVTAALFGLSANSPIVHAQTTQQATEPDEATQPNQAASPDDSQQSDQGDTSAAEQPDEKSDQEPGGDDAGPQDQE